MPRFLEVRRHSTRNKPGQHLSQAGVSLARTVGEGLGPFALVVTSPKPRAFETAIAMGFAVDREIDELGEMGAGVEEEVEWDGGFQAIADAIGRGGATARFAASQRKLWEKLVGEVPKGGSALIVTHGGLVEAGALGCFPGQPLAERTVGCGLCEGVRLTWEKNGWVEARFLPVGQG